MRTDKNTNGKSSHSIGIRSNLRQQTNRYTLIVYILGVIAFIMPLLHIEASSEPSDFVQRVFKFTSWQSFLFAVGFPITLLFFSTILLIVKDYITNDLMKKAIVKIYCGGFLLSFFFITWSLHPALPEDYNKWWYRSNSLFIAILFTLSYVKMINTFTLINLRYKSYFKNLLRFVISDVKRKYVHPSRKDQYIEDYSKEIGKL